MTYTPTQIYGPIILKVNSNYSLANFPGFTYDSSMGFVPANPLNASAEPNELIARSYQGSNTTGITSDYVSQLFFRNQVYQFPYLPLFSSFIPDYYITVGKEIGLNMKEASGSVSLPGGPGSPNDRYEVMAFNYSTDVFLKDGGGTGIAITGMTYSHSIYPGNTTVNASQIFYRKLGRLST